MSVNLQKGQKISLAKNDGTRLTRLMVGLGWDPVEQPASGGFSLFGRKSAPVADVDCDASVILCGADGRIVSDNLEQCCCYFNNLIYGNGALIHSADDLTGGSSDGGDDEMIDVNLPQIPSYVDKMVFVVNIYDANVRNQHFGMVRNAYCRIVDKDTNNEICRFNLSDNYFGMTGLVVGEIYRKNGEWKFNAIGQPVKEASRLGNLVNLYR